MTQNLHPLKVISSLVTEPELITIVGMRVGLVTNFKFLNEKELRLELFFILQEF